MAPVRMVALICNKRNRKKKKKLGKENGCEGKGITEYLILANFCAHWISWKFGSCILRVLTFAIPGNKRERKCVNFGNGTLRSVFGRLKSPKHWSEGPVSRKRGSSQINFTEERRFWLINKLELTVNQGKSARLKQEQRNGQKMTVLIKTHYQQAGTWSI